MIAPALNPRLMTRAEAKAYCRGVDPHDVCPPLAFGRRLLWDKVALDAALDDMMKARGGEALATADSSDDVEGEIERTRKRIAKGAATRRQ